MFDYKNNRDKKEENTVGKVLFTAAATAVGAYLYLKNNNKIDEVRDKVDDIKDEIIDAVKGEDLL
ncbi:MAG: hypothetical protein MRZ08_07095 [Anaerococcus sp.]|uniref:hypothetical protein n=1 Tax=Anaerococcus sp. TaxID=1872515 RepID=UPI002605D407|nr:hypothetical protein [Anaerococcus sp.]MCI5972778.1 hypothetical protein [Anaerococcus sp.]MDD6918145.1 hypothetical protein [Peptoniphilaceae bacterium]MDY2928481.1 hypothetical protein [Anaerococcus sp.]